MVRPLVDLARSMTRADAATLAGVLRGNLRWRFGGGTGEGKHRAFAATEEALASPWLPPRHDVLERAVVIVAAPDFEESLAGEVLHEVRLAAPRATVLLGGHVDGEVGERSLRVSILAAW